jgi:hypothetical protein
MTNYVEKFSTYGTSVTIVIPYYRFLLTVYTSNLYYISGSIIFYIATQNLPTNENYEFIPCIMAFASISSKMFVKLISID